MLLGNIIIFSLDCVFLSQVAVSTVFAFPLSVFALL